MFLAGSWRWWEACFTDIWAEKASPPKGKRKCHICEVLGDPGHEVIYTFSSGAQTP
jgi:hypothetical protein